MSGSKRQIGQEAESCNPGLVSVIVPAYNRENYVERTLKGVREQTYRPIELIVVDDGSTDQTVAVVEKWINANSGDNFRCRLIQQENRGVSAARNAGYYASSGEYIHFLDSDDVPIPVMYERQVTVMNEDRECDYVWSGWHDAPDDGIETAVEHVMTTDARASSGKRVCTMPYLVWPGLFRRRVCETIGGWNEDLYYNEDWEYSSRFLCLEPVIRQLPNTMMIYRSHSGGERVTARATQERANAAKLASIETIRDRMPKSETFRRVLATRLAMMSYSALLHATRQGYTEQRLKARKLCACIMREHCSFVARRWRAKIMILRLLSFSGCSGSVRRLHSIAGSLKKAMGISTGQWFQ